MSGDECGPEIDIRELLICRTCGDVHGSTWDRLTSKGRLRTQLCGCVASGGGREPWIGYDFPTVVELCRCCGRAALPSGSRWCDWFCSLCKPRIQAINRVCGLIVLPLGRHSLLDSVARRPVDLEHAEGAAAPETGDWFERIEFLERHVTCVVLRKLAALNGDCSRDCPLAEYLSQLPRGSRVVASAVVALGTRVGLPRWTLEPTSRSD